MLEIGDGGLSEAGEHRGHVPVTEIAAVILAAVVVLALVW